MGPHKFWYGSTQTWIIMNFPSIVCKSTSQPLFANILSNTTHVWRESNLSQPAIAHLAQKNNRMKYDEIRFNYTPAISSYARQLQSLSHLEFDPGLPHAKVPSCRPQIASSSRWEKKMLRRLGIIAGLLSRYKYYNISLPILSNFTYIMEKKHDNQSYNKPLNKHGITWYSFIITISPLDFDILGREPPF